MKWGALVALAAGLPAIACATLAGLGEFEDAPRDAGAQGGSAGSGGSEAGAGVAGAGGALTCPAGKKPCSGVCVSTSDPATGCGGPKCESCAIPHATSLCDTATNDCAILQCADGYTDCNSERSDGCEAHLADDPTHCGDCGLACSFPNASAICSGGKCQLGSCNSNFENCDGDPVTGCEINLSADPAHCGSCTNACPTESGKTPICSAGICGLSDCTYPLLDCDQDPSKTCETNVQTSVANCGFCGNACSYAHAAASCNQGACELSACMSTYKNCNAQSGDGCEIDTAVSLNNCGACATTCPSGPNGTPKCASGVCGFNCVQGLGDCTSGPGCETDLTSSVSSCGSCGNACAFAHAAATCVASSCAMGACESGFADCNLSSSDGCEVDLNNDAQNCGGCGQPCAAPQVCTFASCATYNDFKDKSLWSTFDTEKYVNPGAHGFVTGAFDGQYVYLVPLRDKNGSHGRVTRLDTTVAFGAATSWSMFDIGANVDGNAVGFFGSAFDGNYVYFVPHHDGLAFHGHVVRYDKSKPFDQYTSWLVYDISSANPSARGYYGAAFDGRYVYFVPESNSYLVPHGLIARYDTTSNDFKLPGAWTIFDLGNNVNAGAKGFQGAAFDGQYIYLVPYYGTLAARYDTKLAFDSAASWQTFDVAWNNPSLRGFRGAAFDGRYVYFVPHWNDLIKYHGLVVRHDTKAAFGDTTSWSVFDVSGLYIGAKGFAGATFDGRYVYFVPYKSSDPVFHGNLVRYDTKGAFSQNAAWSVFDVSSVDPNARGFTGAVFDGRYVYLVPYANGNATTTYDGIVARFDARSPSALPPFSQSSFF